MPGTRSRASAPTTVVQEEPPQESGVRLQFNEPLTWRAGKPIPVGELLRRLQALFREAQNIEQEEADRESLLPIAKELATQNLTAHKDRGVRAWTACCVVEMLRLCAPDAPFTTAQLKDLFTLIIGTILPALADPSNPYNSQHIHVLKSLTEVRSVVVITDVPSSSNLILHLFTTCFDVLSGPSKADSGEELSKNIEHHMTAMLAILVDEATTLPSEVVDVVLAQFLRADPRTMSSGTRGKKTEPADSNQSTLLLREAPPAYNMAKSICNSCPDKMARYISQYFSSVIVDASSVSTSNIGKGRTHRRASDDADLSDDEAPRGPTEEDLHETRKAHRLLRELWRSTPSVLQDIIPQLEVELGAEDVQLRLLATETLGDMVSGIGAAGPPAPPTLNPSAYPSQSLQSPSDKMRVYDFLTTPNSPLSFPSRHAQAYHSFLSRKGDKSVVIRSAFTTSIGRIIMTSAGNVGLDPDEEQKLLRYLSDMLIDSDERVRLAAVKAIEKFDFDDVVQKLGSRGGVAEPGSVLCNLADRVKDRKHNVRTEAMKLLGKIWGVAVGAIAEGSERVNTLLGPIPSRILETYYINDLEINALADRVMFESLIPLSYPPIKVKASQTANGGSQRVKDSQRNGEQESPGPDVDQIRTERVLFLVKDLEEKAKRVFFARQGNQPATARFIDAFLKKCEDYNGGVMDKGEKETKTQLGKLIDFFSKTLPEASKTADDLWKFAKMHDRRCYQLLRFCMAPESDYRRVQKAMKEFTKRIEEASSAGAAMLETLTPLVYRASILVYNKSHVPAIIHFSRTNEKDLGETAHEVLKELSTHNPEVFKTHIKELCEALESEAPTSDKPNGPGAVNDLKACAGFAQKYPKEIPKDRKFVQSMLNFALHGSPPKAAKYGVSVIMVTTDKKEMYAKDILQRCTKNFEYGAGNYLARLAALSQLVLVAAKEIEDDIDSIMDIAIDRVLLNPQAIPDRDETDGAKEPDWADDPDDDCVAKTWALKILVNRLRSCGEQESVEEIAKPIYALLNGLIAKQGELSTKKQSPKAHQSRLRLLAAQLLLKLSTDRRFDALLTAKDFNQLATVAQDSLQNVRSGFVNKLMKYLSQNRLSKRYYTIIFLLAYEPAETLKESAATWIRARSAAFARQKDPAMEALFARFLSLLAHHPDFYRDPDPDKDVDNLKDYVQYIMFYLKCVATEENLSLIYHVAQRVKSIQDGIDPTTSENLYFLSDLAQEVVRRYEEVHGWSMQAWPGKLRMPSGLFAALPNHEVAQEIAMKQYVPEALLDQLDYLVRKSLKTNKRKPDGSGDRAKKRVRMATGAASSRPKALPTGKSGKAARTPKKSKARKDEGAVPSSERRRSGRNVGQKSYVESSESEGAEDTETEDKSGQAGRGSDESSESEIEVKPRPTKSTKKANGASKRNGTLSGKTTQEKVYEISSDSDEELSEAPDTDEEG